MFMFLAFIVVWDVVDAETEQEDARHHDYDDDDPPVSELHYFLAGTTLISVPLVQYEVSELPSGAESWSRVRPLLSGPKYAQTP
jgi:hypothetical protein